MKSRLVGIDDPNRGIGLDVPGVDRALAVALDREDGFVDVFGQHQGQRLEPLDDLVHVLVNALHGLMLVHDPVEAEGPDGGAAQGGEQQAAERVAQRIAEPALERLQPELGVVRGLLTLRHFDEVRADQSGQIDGHGHFE